MGAVRFSLGRPTSEQEIDAVAARLADIKTRVGAVHAYLI
jgi:hypothetical protein